MDQYAVHIPAVTLWGLFGAAFLWGWGIEKRLARMLSIDTHEKVCGKKHVELKEQLSQIEEKLTQHAAESRSYRDRTEGALHEIALKVAVLEVRKEEQL